MSDNVRKIDLSDEFLLDSAERRFQEGNYLSALKMLNKRNEMYAPSADAAALAADIYEAMEIYPLAADSWFRFLDTCNEADFGEGYEGLAVAFMNMGGDIQSALYYHRLLAEDGDLSEEAKRELLNAFTESDGPQLRIVHTDDETAPNPEALRRGLMFLREGELDEAKRALSEIPEASVDYPSAMGLSAMCTLMKGDEEEAERECRELLKTHPENVQALTTFCAVLGARGNKEEARETAKRLYAIKTESADDLFRIATALCETGLDEFACEKLALLSQQLPYDENVLFFHAVAAFRIGKTEEAIEALETLTTVYPRKAVAKYYLVRMREMIGGYGAPFTMNYYYRVPEEEYRTIADFLLKANGANEDTAEELLKIPQLTEFFRIAFDEMEGHDEKLQVLAAKVAVKCRADDFLREILLDYEGEEGVKLSILHDLTVRNEENSFGTVICSLYKEFFTHKIEIGRKKRTPFLKAFADVYAKYALLEEENEGKICSAAEDVYRTIEDYEAWDYADERASLAAVIYRESRIKRAERSLDAVVALFGADKALVQEMLGLMM